MADDKSIQDLERLTQDIIGKFEEALTTSKTSELSSVVNEINKSLEKQTTIIKNINTLSGDRKKSLSDESKSLKTTTSEISKQSDLYNNILSCNDDLSNNWDKIIKNSASFRKTNDTINKDQKKYLTLLNTSLQKDKKLSESTFKKVKTLTGLQAKKTTKSSKTPQFINLNGLSTQISIESLTGGKPYFASHPEMGVPLGLFNTKDEPTKSSRVKSIQKYGASGSLGGVLPQFAETKEIFVPTLYDATDFKGQTAVEFFIKKVLAEMLAPATKYITEFIGTVNKLGDKLQESAERGDEAIRSAIQQAGVLMSSQNWTDMFAGETPLTKAAYFGNVMLDAQRELAGEGVNYNIEALSELQKSFNEYSNTNVLLGKKDLKNLAYIQSTFDLAASDVGEMQSSFMELGLGSEDLIDYATNLRKDATKFGVNAGKLLKDLPKLLKESTSYRFRGGVKDLEKMQVYAARTKLNIEDAYNIMDKTMTIEGAVDMAAQLQLLGGPFTDISSLDLLSKSLTDPEGLAEMITERIRSDTRFGSIDESTGEFKTTAAGRKLAASLKQIEGFENMDVFKMLTQSAKEKDIKEQLLGGVNKAAFLAYTEDQQKQILSNLAQGSTKTLNLTGQKIATNLLDFSETVLSTSTSNMDVGAVSAANLASVKDIAEINKTLVDTQIQLLPVFDGLNTGLKKLQETLLSAGEVILNVGLQSFTNPFYRALEVYTDYLGLSTKEVVWLYSFIKEGKLAPTLKYFIDNIDTLLESTQKVNDAVDWITDNYVKTVVNPPWWYKPFDPLTWRKPWGENESWYQWIFEGIYGGEQTDEWKKEPKGGVVAGKSHYSGGVKGLGAFNNIEVEGGEAIINKQSTKTFLPLLSKLNEIGGGESLTSKGFDLSMDSGDGDTINLNITGRLEYNSVGDQTGEDLMDLAKELQELSEGKRFDGAY